jgi:hypothetical protein
MTAKERVFRKYRGLSLTLVFLMGMAVLLAPGVPTLAGPPEPGLPQPEPIQIRLERLPAAAAQGTAPPAHVDVSADPGTWYNVGGTAEEFDGDFPPAGWAVQTDSGTGWAKRDEQQVSDGYSAGVVTSASETLESWLIYGGPGGFAMPGPGEAADAKLHFNFWLDSQKDVVLFGWAASSDGQNFDGSYVSGQVGAWLTGELDMRQYVGDDSVWIAFFVVTEEGATPSGSQQVYVDNVVVRALAPYLVHLPAVSRNYSPPEASFTFTDNFSDLDSGWPKKVVSWSPKKNVYGYTDKLTADYPNNYDIVTGECRAYPGSYFMRMGESSNNPPRIVVRSPVQVEGQFTLEADITFCDEAPGASAGLVFGLNDDASQFFRVILIRDAADDTTDYAVWRDTTILVSTSGSEYLKGGFQTNHVKIVRDECTIRIYFNGHLERTLTDRCAYRDRRWVGLFHDLYYIWGMTGAVVDNFRVEKAWEPAD